MLRDLTGEILSGDSPEALLARLPDIVDELLPVDACSVLMLHGSSFTAEEQELAQTIAALVAMAIQQHHVERHLRALAQRDPLTGLLTRDALQDSLARLLRAGTPCALLLLHLDEFKRFNAAHGQQAGDSLLREAGRLLCEEVRAGDESFRYGGEELAVVLPNADG